MKDKKKDILSVLQGFSLRELVEKVNKINQISKEAKDKPLILKEDIVFVFKDNETYFLLYYK